MLQRNPEITTFPPTYPLTIENDLSSINPDQADLTHSSFIEKHARKIRSRQKLATAALVTTAILTSAYVTDTNINIEKEKQAELTIDIVAPPLNPENSDTALLFFDGFNANQADYLGGKLAPGLQAQIDGEVWSTNFNNDLTNRDELLETTTKLAEERNIKHLIVVGYSKGGINGNELSVDIVTQSWTNVDATILISTPSNYDGLRPYQQKELEAGMLLSKLWRVRYSTPARFGGEVYFYRDQYTQGNFNGDILHDTEVVIDNVENFFDVIKQVWDRFRNPSLTTMSFLIEQVDEIDKANFSEEFAKLTEAEETKQKPVIVYLGTAEPAFDTIVDDKKSGDSICEAAEENNLTCIRDNVEGAIHSQYYQTIDQYNESFARIGEALRSSIAKEQAAVAIKRTELAKAENRYSN